MSKGLAKAALIVGAVALVATGVGAAASAGLIGVGTGATATVSVAGITATAGTLSTIGTIASLTATGLTAVAGLTAKSPAGTAGGSQTEFTADPQAGVPYAMGRTGTAGNIVFRRAADGWSINTPNDLNDMVTILSLGPIDGIEAFTSDRAAIGFDGTGNAIGDYRDKMFQRTQLGACPEPSALTVQAGASSAPSGWTGSHKLSGLAAAMWRLRYDSKQRFFQNGVPAPMWVIRAVLVYDPRQDSTYPGGSGPQRWDDEATWGWSENPYLHALTWCIGRHQNGKRVAGLGASIDQIIVSDFVEGANIADVNGWTISGVVYTRPDTKWNVLKQILQAGAGEPLRVGARLGCLINTPRVSLATITIADIVGTASIKAMQPIRNRLNTVTPRYRSEAHNWEVVPAARISVVDHVIEDGDERSREITYQLVASADQAATLARYDIENSREFGPITMPLKPAWLNYKAGDCLTLDVPEAANRKVLLLQRSIEPQTGSPTFQMRSETDAKHPFALGQTGSPPPTASISPSDPTVDAPIDGVYQVSALPAEADGTSKPGLVFTGVVGNGNADAVIFEYRLYDPAALAEEGWTGASIEPPTTVRKEVTGLQPETLYQGGVRYRVHGVIGARRLLGPTLTSMDTTKKVVDALVDHPEFLDAWIATGTLTSDQKRVLLADTASIQAGFADFAARGASYGVPAQQSATQFAIVKAYVDYVAGLPDINSPTPPTPVDAAALAAKRADAYGALAFMSGLVQTYIGLVGWKPPEQTNVDSGVVTGNSGYSGSVPAGTPVQVISSNIARADQMQGKIRLRATGRVICGLSRDRGAVTGPTSIQYGLEFVKEGADWKVYRFTQGVRGDAVDIRNDGTIDTFNDGVQIGVHYLRGAVAGSVRGDLSRLVQAITLGNEEFDADAFYFKAILYPGAVWDEWRWNDQTTLEMIDVVIAAKANDALTEAVNSGSNVASPSLAFFTRGTPPNLAGEFTFMYAGDRLFVRQSPAATIPIASNEFVSVALAAASKSDVNAAGSAFIYVQFLDPTGASVGVVQAFPIPITSPAAISYVARAPIGEGEVTSVRVWQELAALSNGQVKMKAAVVKIDNASVFAGNAITSPVEDKKPPYYYAMAPQVDVGVPGKPIQIEETKSADQIGLPVPVTAGDSVVVRSTVFWKKINGGGFGLPFIVVGTISQVLTYKGVEYRRGHSYRDPELGQFNNAEWDGPWGKTPNAVYAPITVAFNPGNTDLRYEDAKGNVVPLTTQATVTSLGTPGDNLLTNPTFKLGLSGYDVAAGAAIDWAVVSINGRRTLERAGATASSRILRSAPIDVTGLAALTLTFEQEFAGVSGDPMMAGDQPQNASATYAAIEWLLASGQVSYVTAVPGKADGSRVSVSASRRAEAIVAARVRLTSGVIAAGGYSRFARVKLEKGAAATQFVDDAADITGKSVVTIDPIEPINVLAYPDGTQPTSQYPINRRVVVRVGGKVIEGVQPVITFAPGPGLTTRIAGDAIFVDNAALPASTIGVSALIGDSRVTTKVQVEQTIIPKPAAGPATTDTFTDNTFQIVNTSEFQRTAGPLTVRADSQGRVKVRVAASWQAVYRTYQEWEAIRVATKQANPGKIVSSMISRGTGLQFVVKVKTSPDGQAQIVAAPIRTLAFFAYNELIYQGDPDVQNNSMGLVNATELTVTGFQPGQSLTFELHAARDDTAEPTTIVDDAIYLRTSPTPVQRYVSAEFTVTNDTATSS